MSEIRLLLHTCCAPCSVYCVRSLRQEGIEPTAFWYNPNIHPYTEYAARRDTLIAYTKSVGQALVIHEDYGLRHFVQAVAEDIDRRCDHCYTLRLEETARFAAENGFTHFSSTLFVSPYQNHRRMQEIAEQMAKRYGAAFLYRDFRPGFREGQAIAREQGLYLQKYCGCIFSEEERYAAKIQRDLKLFDTKQRIPPCF